MSNTAHLQREKLVLNVVFSPDAVKPEEIAGQLRELGTIDYTSDTLPLLETTFYEKEMGPGLRRFVVSFLQLVSPGYAIEAKTKANEIENSYRTWSGSRVVNIDPGFVNLHKFITVSSHDRLSRIPLRDGFFGELVMVYKNNEWHTFPWTYPEYCSREYKDILTGIRGRYWQLLQSQTASL